MYRFSAIVQIIKHKTAIASMGLCFKPLDDCSYVDRSSEKKSGAFLYIYAISLSPPPWVETKPEEQSAMGAIYEAVPQLSRIAVLGAERFESLGRPASQWASIDGDYIWLHCASLYAVVQYLSNTMIKNQSLAVVFCPVSLGLAREAGRLHSLMLSALLSVMHRPSLSRPKQPQRRELVGPSLWGE